MRKAGINKMAPHRQVLEEIIFIGRKQQVTCGRGGRTKCELLEQKCNYKKKKKNRKHIYYTLYCSSRGSVRWQNTSLIILYQYYCFNPVFISQITKS